jgi:CDP-glycerol glycerophosphotransferase (TagB/SpsB family)
MILNFIYPVLDFFFYLINQKKISQINRILKNNSSELKKNILIQIDHKGQLQHVSGIIELLLKNKNHNNLLLSSNSDLKFLKKIINKKIMLVDGKYVKFLKNIRLCLKCNFEDKSPSDCESIFLGHGFLVKRNTIPKKYFEEINHIFLYGPSQFKVLKFYMKKEGFDRSKIKFWKIGYPNYDDQFNNNYNVKKIKKNLSLNKKKCILFSPAWESRKFLSEDLDRISLIFSKIKKYNFIIKLHPSLFVDKKSPAYIFYTDGIDWKKKLIDLEKKYQNIYFFRDLKINPLFKLCKLMITDYSGVAIGFMLEKKPVIFFNRKKNFDKDLIKLGYETTIGKNSLINSGRNHGIKINNYSQIGEAIAKIFCNYKFYQKRINNFHKNYLFNPGKATGTAYKTINLIVNS